MVGITTFPKKTLLAVFVIFLSCFISLLVFDRVLSSFGFPTDVYQDVTYPPYFHEVRKNIEFTYDVQANRQGFRSHDIPLSKPIGTKRIFVAGDSFVEGVGINVGARFVDQLEQRIQVRNYSLEWINGGLRGTGPEKYGKAFLYKGVDYSPDGLIMCVFANDVTDSPTSLTELKLVQKFPRRSWKRKMLHAIVPSTYMLGSEVFQNTDGRNDRVPYNFVAHMTQVATKRGISLKRIDAWKASIPEHVLQAAKGGTFNAAILSMGLLRPWYWTDALDINTERAKSKAKVFFKHLDVILRKARQERIEVAVVYIPTRFQYDMSSHDPSRLDARVGTVLNPTWLNQTTQLEMKLDDWARSHHIPFFNLTPLFRNRAVDKEDLTFFYDGHWTVKGHHLAARFIEAWLKTGEVFSFMKNFTS